MTGNWGFVFELDPQDVFVPESYLLGKGNDIAFIRLHGDMQRKVLKFLDFHQSDQRVDWQTYQQIKCCNEKVKLNPSGERKNFDQIAVNDIGISNYENKDQMVARKRPILLCPNRYLNDMLYSKAWTEESAELGQDLLVFASGYNKQILEETCLVKLSH